MPRVDPVINVPFRTLSRGNSARSRLTFEDFDETEISENVGSPTNESRGLNNVGSQTGLVGFPRVLDNSNLMSFSTPLVRGSSVELSGIASVSAGRRGTLPAMPRVPERWREAASGNSRMEPVPRITEGAEGVYMTMEAPSVNPVDHGTPVQSMDEILSSTDWAGNGSVVRLDHVTDTGIRTRIDRVINRVPEQGLPDSETPIRRYPGRLRPPRRPFQGRGTPGPPPHIDANVIISPPSEV